MLIFNNTTASKVAARIINEAGRINKDIRVTISERSPESIKYSKTIPRKQGWMIADKVPVNKAGRKDYVRFLMGTQYKEVFIRVATAGGKSRIYVR